MWISKVSLNADWNSGMEYAMEWNTVEWNMPWMEVHGMENAMEWKCMEWKMPWNGTVHGMQKNAMKWNSECITCIAGAAQQLYLIVEGL